MLLIVSICPIALSEELAHPLSHPFDPQKVFREVVRLVDAYYFLKDSGPKPWEALWREALPYISGNTSRAALKETLKNLLRKANLPSKSLLYQGDNRYWIVRSLLRPLDPLQQSVYNIGALFKRRGRRWFIEEVFDQSPAMMAGLRRGDEMIAVNNKPFDPVFSFFSNSAQESVALRYRSLPWLKPSEKEVTLSKYGYLSRLLKSTQSSQLVIEKEGKKIAYYHLWSGHNKQFFNSLASSLRRFEETSDVLILDLRGGFLDGFYGFSRLFLGSRAGAAKTKALFTKKVILLINEDTAGSRELLTYRLKKEKRVIVVGSKTQGQYLKRRYYFFYQDRWLLTLPVAGSLSGNGTTEGIGVMPNIYIEETLVYAAGHDSLLEQAYSIAAKM